MKALLRTTATLVVCTAISTAVRAEDQTDAAWRNTVWYGYKDFLQPDWSKDLSATVGIKVWMNEWRRDSFFTSNVGVDNNTFVSVGDSKPNANTSHTEATPIPQISIKYKWLFATASYYSSTTFEFDDTVRTQRRITNGNTVSTRTVRDQASSDRYEYDFAAGLFIHPNIAIFGGYKRIRQDQFFTLTPDVGSPASIESNLDIDGPTIGIAASVPMGGGFGLYANFAHGFMTAQVIDNNTTTGVKVEQARVDHDATYDVAEGGITYTHGLQNLPVHLPLSAASVYAGYRYQAFETDTNARIRGEGGQRSDTTNGFVVGANLVW